MGSYREARAIYLGSIAYSDFLLGRLLDALDETRQAETTAVMVFSDHGDYAGSAPALTLTGLMTHFRKLATFVGACARLPEGSPQATTAWSKSGPAASRTC